MFDFSTLTARDYGLLLTAIAGTNLPLLVEVADRYSAGQFGQLPFDRFPSACQELVAALKARVATVTAPPDAASDTASTPDADALLARLFPKGVDL